MRTQSMIKRRGFVFGACGTIGTGVFAQESRNSRVESDATKSAIANPREAAFVRDYPRPQFEPKWEVEQINREMAVDFVQFGHNNLDMVKLLLDREPTLLNATIDWGGGDWETALGGASHMGRRDIAEFLISRGARMDIFCAAMLGLSDVVKGMLNAEPQLIDAKGPHGFSLHFHAKVGRDAAKPLLEYLQSIKEVAMRPAPFLKGE